MKDYGAVNRELKITTIEINSVRGLGFANMWRSNETVNMMASTCSKFFSLLPYFKSLVNKYYENIESINALHTKAKAFIGKNMNIRWHEASESDIVSHPTLVALLESDFDLYEFVLFMREKVYNKILIDGEDDKDDDDNDENIADDHDYDFEEVHVME